MKRPVLSGWQRLWVLLISLYLPVVAFFVAILMPNEGEILSSWLYEALDVVQASVDPDQRMSAWELREKYSDMSDRELIDRIEKKYLTTESDISRSLQKVHDTQQSRLDGLFIRQVAAVGYGLLAWAVPSVLLYLLGAGIAWVVRGFRQP